MPMYSFGTKNIAGYGHATYTHYTEGNLFQHIQLGIVSTRYAKETVPFIMHFNKIAPELTFEFKKRRATSPFTHTVKYRNITLFEEYDKQKFENNTVSHTRTGVTSNFNDLSYIFSKKDVIVPYTILANVQQGENMAKTSLTVHYSYHFKSKNKGVDIRLFAGTFLGTSITDAGPYRFRLSGQTGSQDYLYDDIFLGRTETKGVLANQFTETDGGFKFYSPIGQTGKWLAAVNIKSSLGNIKLPINLFADIGITATDGRLKEDILFDAGISISVRKDVFEIFFPLLISEDFKNNKKIRNVNYLETVRFVLNFNSINPFNLIRNFSL